MKRGLFSSLSVALVLAMALAVPRVAHAQIDPTPAEQPNADEASPPPAPPPSQPAPSPPPQEDDSSPPPPPPPPAPPPGATSPPASAPYPAPAPNSEPAPASPPYPVYPPYPGYPGYPGQPPPPRRHRENHAFYSIEAGYLYENLYSVPINSLDITGVIGESIGNFGVGAILQGAPGKTEGGLDTFTFSAGALFEGRIDRIRVGGGVTLGAFNAQRITTSDSLTTGTIGVFGRLTVDVIQFEHDGGLGPPGGVFLVAKASYGSAGGDFFGVTWGIGVRY